MHFTILLHFSLVFKPLMHFAYIGNEEQEVGEDFQQDIAPEEPAAEVANLSSVDQGKPRFMLPGFFNYLLLALGNNC